MKKTVLILIVSALIALLPSCQKTEEDVSKDVSAVSEPVAIVSDDESSEIEDSSEVEESDNKEQHEYVKNQFDYTFVKDEFGHKFIEKYNGSDPYIIVPNSLIGGEEIYGIYPDAFEGCDFIKGIKLEGGFRSVGVRGDLDKISYSEELFGCGGFCGCTSVEELEFLGTVKYIAPIVDTNIEELIIPAYTHLLSWGTFQSNKKLKKVVFLGTDTDIDLFCFSGCDALEELELPIGLTGLPRGAITNCTALKKLRLPDGFCSEPMWLPTGCTYYVVEGTRAHKTMLEYNSRDPKDYMHLNVVVLRLVEVTE